MQNPLQILAGSAAVVALALAPLSGSAETKLTLMLSADGPEVEIVEDMLSRYKKVAPDVTIEINLVGYNVIREQLPIQLEAGAGPDIGKITDTGGLNPYYVDLTPYVSDPDQWNQDYGGVLPWYRAGKPGKQIYAFHNEMTVTGPYVNLTMFDDAGVEVPAPGATWDDWADATRMVMDKGDAYAGMIMDRSGHRMAGPAMSYGAKYFDANGNLLVDEGFTSFSQRMVDWHKEGLMPPDIWPKVSGSKYANGNEMFFAGEVPFYMSGSWNIANVQKNMGDKYDWSVVPVPCGPAGCGIMPGGSGFVAFNTGKHPAEAAKFVAWLGEYEQAKEWYGRRFAIPANARIQKEGIDYTKHGADEAVSAGLNTFAAAAARAKEETPQAYRLQGYPKNFAIFNATTKYLAGVMNGEMDLDTALNRIREEVSK